ncbi:MAG: hypothetical protein JWO97_335 [Acidobacteria bacterium]|nr:hypothetical protein [Acidobacteriota bacterium]
MTRRDAALLTLTLAGIYCLFSAVMLLPEIAKLFRPESAELPQLTGTLPLMLLTCAGVALIHGRRKFMTFVFGENPSHDATALAGAGDMRLLAVRIAGLLLFAQFARSLQAMLARFATPLGPEMPPLFVASAAPLGLGAAVAFFFLRPRTVVRWLFAAGPGEGRSASYRENLEFALGIVGAYFVAGFIGGVATGIAEATASDPHFAGPVYIFFTTGGADLCMVLVGIGLFIGRRTLASIWSTIHPMGIDTP